jgi:hypothetical protein
MDRKSIDGWITVFTTGTDYEGEIVKDRLVDSGLSAVVLTHRDHAFNLTVGDMATVRVLVPPSEKEEALRILHSQPFTEDELNSAALAADPSLDDDDS